MTQYFDFVALGWVEKNLREELDAAKKLLYLYEREPDAPEHLSQARDKIHSATGALRLCALDPAALLTEEVERVLQQLLQGGIAGESRKLAMTEVVAAIEAMPAYLANVKAKREVSAAAIATIVNDLRQFGNRPTLPESMFFNPIIDDTSGVTSGVEPAEDDQLKKFAASAMRVCHKFSKPALARDHQALKRLYAVGKHAYPVLVGTKMEAYFRCYMGLIEALAQSHTRRDEVIVDILKNTFVLLKSIALDGRSAVYQAKPEPYIQKMLYYIAATPTPTPLQQELRESFGVHNIADSLVESHGRLIQEDDLLDALEQTHRQLMQVMEFLSLQHQDVSIRNTQLNDEILPSLNQVSKQLKAIGLISTGEAIAEQHSSLQKLAQREECASQSELIDFGGALMAVKENLEYKLKHGLSASGDGTGHDLDAAITEQTVRCLERVKHSIRCEFARQDLFRFRDDGVPDGNLTASELRPLYRAAKVVQDFELLEHLYDWDMEDYPSPSQLYGIVDDLLYQMPDGNDAPRAALEMEQVLSVLKLMEDKERECEVLQKCVHFIRESIALGGLRNDSAMTSFAESIAALEQFMERRAEDPLGDAQEHLIRAELLADNLEDYLTQRANQANPDENVIEFEGRSNGLAAADTTAATTETAVQQAADIQPEMQEPSTLAEEAARNNVVTLEASERHSGVELEAQTAQPDQTEHTEQTEQTEQTGEILIAEDNSDAREPTVYEKLPELVASQTLDVDWREALELWASQEFNREHDAPREDPDLVIDEELVECFVEEARKYSRKLDEAVERFSSDLESEKHAQDIRAIFHTMKGSARTIELNEFGQFMYDMEKIFNSLRDGYIGVSKELAEFVSVVAAQMPAYIDLLMQRIPLYNRDFAITRAIAEAIYDKTFTAKSRLELGITEDTILSASALTVAEVVELPKTSSIVPEDTSPAADTGADNESHVEDLAPEEQEVELELLVDEHPQVVEVAEPQQLDTGTADAILMEDSSQETPETYSAENSQAEDSEFAAAIADVVSDETVTDPDTADITLSATVDNPQDNLQASLDEAFDSQIDDEQHDDTDPIELFAQPAPELEGEMTIATEMPETVEPEAHELATDSADTENDNSNRVIAFRETELASALNTIAKQGDSDAVEVDYPPIAMVEEIDTELLELFIETLDEYLSAIDSAMERLEARESDSLRDLKNTLHTIKGSAKSVGLAKFGTLIHDTETGIEDLEHSADLTQDASIRQIYNLVDSVHIASQQVSSKRADWNPDVEEEATSVNLELNPIDEEEQQTKAPLDLDAANAEVSAERKADFLRVETHKVDRLLDLTQEVSMSNVRSRHALDAAAQDGLEVQGLARRVQTLVDKITLQLDTEIQARTQSLGDGEHFDPLEMDRITEKQGLAAILREAAYDLEEEATNMTRHVDNAGREASGAARLLQNSQSDLRLLRLVSFSKLGPGFRRLVHQVSRQLGKQVEFEMNCGEGGLDVAVFEQIKIALQHMLRNSIDHGIDTPELRQQRGKSETGSIRLDIKRKGTEFMIRLLDDGNGIDPDVLRRKARESGLISAADDLNDDQALRLILRSGLSTAKSVTDISGRGVGMDAVYQSITQVGGSIEIDSKAGFFTQIDVRIPASLMVNGALLASVGEEQVAIPLTSLDGSDFCRRADIHREASVPDGRISFRNEEYQLRYLGSVRGIATIPSEETMPEFVPVLFAHYENRRVAFFVDALTNAEEMVIRSLGAQFTGVPGVAGGAVRSDGQPILALDLNELIRQIDHSDRRPSIDSRSSDNSTVILCVDDSVMMRRTYEKRLESLGYEVVTAVDGEDALDYLQESKRLPDFIFTDLEMPNMNGFDFIANMRRMPALEQVPTVVVSSRDGEKHRAEATRVGATGFMAKGSNSAEGMQMIIQRYLSTDAMAS